MKAWHAVVLFGLIAIIAAAQILAYNHNNKTPVPYPTPFDMPRYSLPDVIYIAQQSNPGVPNETNPLYPRFTGQYEGNGIWEIIKEVGRQNGNVFTPITKNTQYGYFYESTGKMYWYDSPQPALLIPTTAVK